MELTLVFGALLLGAAGIPHCAAMCGPACAAVVGSRSDPSGRNAVWAFQAARLTGYAGVGALAAAGVGLAEAMGSSAPVLRPVWILLHMAAMALGLWLAITGRQPGWMSRVLVRQPTGSAWQPVNGPRGALRTRSMAAMAAGLFWVAWPCGLLQSAVVMAALANTPLGGAGVMAAFATASAAGLWWGPWALSRVSPGMGGRVTEWAVRGAGVLLAVGSAWALGHDVWMRVVAYCFG